MCSLYVLLVSSDFFFLENQSVSRRVLDIAENEANQIDRWKMTKNENGDFSYTNLDS